MGRMLAVIGTMSLLMGCAMPVGVQMASYAIQGMSLAATNKTLTDHGISVVAEKDCALWRGLSGDPVCAEWDADDGMTAVAAADGDTSTDVVATDVMADRGDGADVIAVSGSSSTPPEVPEAQVDVVDLADFATAAGDSNQVIATAATVKPPAASVTPLAPVASLAPATPFVSGTSLNDAKPGDVYFIIGSFRTTERALNLVSMHPDLSPDVVRAEVDGRAVFRVAVGPYAPTDQDIGRQRLSAAGINSTWALPYDPASWEVVDSRRPVGIDVARLAP